MALLAKGTWVVVADGEKALILENAGTPRAPRLTLHAKMAQPAAPTHELGADRPGRFSDPGPNQRSAAEMTDLHRQAKERFAREVAERLNALVERADVGRLVIAAPPQTLAVLREGLSPEVAARVIAELPKTLTHHPLSRLGDLVAEQIDPL